MNKLIAGAMCLFATGCVEMVNPSNPGANYASDYSACQYQATQMYPVQMQTSTTPSVTNTNCNLAGSTANCTSTTSPGREYASGGDMNLGSRIAATFSCMDAKGWRTQSTTSSRAPRRSSYDEAVGRPSRVGESCTDSKQCGLGEVCVVDVRGAAGICR